MEPERRPRRRMASRTGRGLLCGVYLRVHTRQQLPGRRGGGAGCGVLRGRATHATSTAAVAVVATLAASRAAAVTLAVAEPISTCLPSCHVCGPGRLMCGRRWFGMQLGLPLHLCRWSVGGSVHGELQQPLGKWPVSQQRASGLPCHLCFVGGLGSATLTATLAAAAIAAQRNVTKPVVAIAANHNL